jgi:hypothetical protein
MLIILSCGAAPGLPDDAVIVVEGDTVYLEDMESRLAGFEGDTARAMLLADAVTNRLLVLEDASRRGLDTLEETRRIYYERLRERLQHRLTAHFLDRVEISDDTVAAFYDGMGTQAGYLVVSSMDSAAAASWARRLRAGEQPPVFQGESLRVEHMGPTDLMRLDPEVAGLLSDMEEGDVSDPVGLGVYWRVYRLDSLRSVDPGSFEENRHRIHSLLLSRRRESVKRAMEDSLRAAYDLSVDTAVVEMVAEMATSRSGDHEPYGPEEADMEAYTWQGGSRSALWLANNIRGLPEGVPRQAQDPEWIAGYCNILGLYDIMATAATEMGMDTLPEVRSRVRQAREQYLLDLYHDSVITPRIQVTDSMLTAAYENQEEPVTVPERRVFDLLMAQGQEELERLDSLVEAGDPFVEGAFSPHPMFSESEGSYRTRPMEPGELPVQIADSLMGVPEGELVRFDIGESTAALFRAGEVVPAREATYEEALPEIRRRVRTALEEEAVSALVDSLRQVYDYTINKDLIYGSCGSDSTAAQATGGRG